MRYGTTKAIMDMSKESSVVLWEALEKYDGDKEKMGRAFWKVLDGQFPAVDKVVLKFTIPKASSGISGGGDGNGGRSDQEDTGNMNKMMTSMIINEKEQLIKKNSSNVVRIPLKVYLPTSTMAIQMFVNPYLLETNEVNKSNKQSISSVSSTSSTPQLLSSSAMLSSMPKNTSKTNTATLPETYVAQTIGTVLNTKLPELFPSKRQCILARPMMHGVEIPMSAPLLEVLQEMCYPDGFLHLSVVMMS